MRKIKIGALLAISASPAFAQAVSYARPRTEAAITAALTSGHAVAVKLNGASTLHGRLESAGTDSVVIVMVAARVAVARASITELRDAGTAHTRGDGSFEYWFPNPNTTRLFFGPTGRTLKRGEAYFADYYVAFAGVSVGVTDRITLGGGSLILPNANFWFLTPKFGLVRNANANVAVGALVLKFGEEDPAGITYAVGTLGNTDRSITAGLGYGFSGSDVADNPVAMFGGERRISKRMALVTENYLISGAAPLVSYGVRFMGEKISVDLALLNMLGTDMVFPGIPFVDFVIKF